MDIGVLYDVSVSNDDPLSSVATYIYPNSQTEYGEVTQR